MPKKAKFTQGSTLLHVITMSATGAFGLMFMFLVDLVDMLFLSMLGQKEAVAAVGFAGTILFFTISISIAVSIAATALVSKAVGQGDMRLAKQRAVNVLVYGVIFSSLFVWWLWPKIPHLLLFIGANGRALDLAIVYLQIVLVGMPAVMIGMIGSGIMRAIGDARRAMYVTLVGGLVNAALDPIFIFALGMEVQGAAIASLLARLSMVWVTYYAVVRIHNMLGQFDWVDFMQDAKTISVIAIPATLTNLSSPLSNAFVMAQAADFGDDVVAAMAIIGRVIPVVFGGLFALSGAVGPILGQNYGARLFNRMQSTLVSAVTYSFVYCLLLCVGLYQVQAWLVQVFNATAATADLVQYFATYISFSFFFQSLLFIAIATFNNLGRPYWSTGLNFARATLGTWPLITLFSLLVGAKGILLGQAIGSILFGCLGFYMAWRYIQDLSGRQQGTIPPVAAPLMYDDVNGDSPHR